MEVVGQIIIYIMMIFVLLGAGALVLRPKSELGQEFRHGLETIGPIFLPVAGILVLVPWITQFIHSVVGPVYSWMHADPSMAVGTFLAGDLGAYQVAFATAGSHGAWMMAFAASLTSGWIIVFGIPVGLAMLRSRDHKYLALGMMAGLLSVPFAVFFVSIMLSASGVLIREDIATAGPSTAPFDISFAQIMINLLPLAIIMIILAIVLRFFTNFAVKAFMILGRVIEIITIISVALSIVEYFTGFFSAVLGFWPLDPLMADGEESVRALEIAGAIGIMLAGAFPMVFLIRRGLATPLAKFGRKVGISEAGMAGFLAAAANPLALYRMIAIMPPKDKVLTLAFVVSGTAILGDHLAFTANFQPSVLPAMMIGKFIGGIIAIFLAIWLVLPQARRLEEIDREQGVISPGEYELEERHAFTEAIHSQPQQHEHQGSFSAEK